MEILSESETIGINQKHFSLEEERARMNMSLLRVTDLTSAQINAARKELRPALPRRDSRPNKLGDRANSMRLNRPLAPTKSTDAAASMRGSSTQRQNSSKALLRANSNKMLPRRAPPTRTSSVDSTNSLRAYRKDQLANNLAERQESFRVGRKDSFRSGVGGGTLGRQESTHSIMSTGTTDLSVFTQDSVNLRKTQLEVADPLEDAGSYVGDDSFADHESLSRASGYKEFVPEVVRSGSQRLDKWLIHDDINISTRSFSTMASGLTTGFTEHDEFDFEDDDEDEEEDPME